jgi:hypothetical protein
MKCPTCGGELSPLKLIVYTRWTPIKCPACGKRCARDPKRNLQLFSIYGLLLIAVKTLRAVDMPIGLKVCVGLLAFFLINLIDSSTTKLIPVPDKENSSK